MVSLLRKGQVRKTAQKGPRKFVDLNNVKIPEPEPDTSATVKVAELYSLEDAFKLMNFIYNGTILLVDCKFISSDEGQLKRVVDQLKSAVRDVNGDLAALSKDFYILTPKGIKIDRTKIKGSF